MADLATPSPFPSLLSLTAQIDIAHIAANPVPVDALPALIASVHQALADAGVRGAPEVKTGPPIVPIERCIHNEYLVCLEDGAKLKVLTRYLVRFGLTPDTYRAKWGFTKTYPMVAPAAAAKYSASAQELWSNRASHPDA